MAGNNSYKQDLDSMPLLNRIIVSFGLAKTQAGADVVLIIITLMLLAGAGILFYQNTFANRTDVRQERLDAIQRTNAHYKQRKAETEASGTELFQ